jgi:methionyl-tRNA synthetase
MNTEDEAKKISDEGIDAIKSFVTGFSKFIEEKHEEHKKYVIEAYSKMNISTLIYNAMILQEELEKRMKVKE